MAKKIRVSHSPYPNIYDTDVSDSDKEFIDIARSNIYEDTCIVTDGMNYKLISREDLDKVKKGMRYDGLRHQKVIDLQNGTTFYFDAGANLIDSTEIEEMDEQFSRGLAVENIEHDIFGNKLDSFMLSKPKDKKQKVFTNKIEMNLRKVFLSIDDHRSFWESKELVDSETSFEKLIKFAFLQPDQFDEVFTVEIDRPESPLMRRFLEKLAILVNEQLRDNEEGLDNIEELQKKAYEFAGYQGKSFETVISESKDYYRHLRYLLTKDEKVVISEWDKNYFDSLVKLLDSKKSLIKKKSIDYEVCEMIGYSTICYYREKIPNFSMVRGKLESSYFAFVEKIRDAADELDNSNLSLRIAMIDDLLCKEYVEETKNGAEKHTYIFVCDRNLNFAKFAVKSGTLLRWKRNLEKKIILSDYVISHGETSFPVNLNDNVL